MDDKHLLEMAAKAVNLPHKLASDTGLYYKHENPENEFEITGVWNPLTDDGDAFRLMVALGMEVYVDTHPRGCECTEVESHTYEKSGRYIFNHEGDISAATRRAIVRCAAEIGENM